MLNIFPSIAFVNYSNADIPSIIIKCLEVAEHYLNNNISTRKSLSIYMKEIGATSKIVHTSVMAPISWPSNNMYDDYNTLMAWLLCFLSARNKRFLQLVIDNYRPSINLPADFVNDIISMRASVSFRNETVKNMMKDDKTIKSFISNIRKTMATSFTDQRALRVAAIKDSPNNLFRNIVTNCYTQLVNKTIEDIIRSKYTSNRLVAMARHFLSIKNGFISHARLLNEMEGESKNLET